MDYVNNYPVNYTIALFPGFQALDVFGPLDVLNIVSTVKPLNLNIIAETLDPVSTMLGPHISGSAGPSIGQSVVPTHTFDNPPEYIEVLIVPGGKGTRDTELTQPVVDYIEEVYPKLDYLLTICTGSALAARAGVLDMHRATSNKRSLKWVAEQSPNVYWVDRARWVISGNIWSSSGIAAGIDMMYDFIEMKFSRKLADDISLASEYVRTVNPDEDHFAMKEIMFDPFAKDPADYDKVPADYDDGHNITAVHDYSP